MAEYLDTLRLDHLKTDGPGWGFISDSQDVAAMRANLPPEALELSLDLDAFFICVCDGDYSEIWGINGVIPFTYKNAYRIL